MILVVDTNIIISALIRGDGVVGSMLLKTLKDIEKISCYYLYIEVFDKKDKMLKASKLTNNDFLELLYLLIRQINFINEDQISLENWQKARELTNDIDVKDVSFVALALQTNAYLWTGDKKLYEGLRQKGFLNVLNVDDLRQIFEK